MFIFLGSFFYAGFLPKFPGTWTSLITLAPVYGLSLYSGPWGLLVFLAICCLLTYLTAPEFERLYGRDPAAMVTDEAAGQTATFLLIPFTGTGSDLWLMAGGLVLFRLFDILKPLGLYQVQRLPGAHGILIDDLIAGIYAYICLKFIILVVL
ncbi:MAG: phosphatidylglycerophosphatase A [Balneolales bacterium]